MDLLIFTSKSTSCKVYKKYLVLFGCILFASITTSCHKNISKINSPQLCVADSLHILYLNNTANNPELKKLLDSARYRVTFQFYHDSTGALNLDAWPMIDTSGIYMKNSAKLLHEASASGISISGVKVNIGNIHLDQVGRDSLYSDTNRTGYQYILFFPRIQIDTLKGLNNVVYDVYGSPTLPIPGPPPPPPSIKIATIAKPSPPYKGN
jgi:hypothetical protein